MSREQSIDDALREYLKREYGLALGVGCFDSMPELPEYLVMKIAICQKDGKVLQILREYPDLDKIGSRVSGEVILAGTAQKTDHPWWPAAGELPERTVLPDSGNKTAYPALSLADGKVESGVYLDELEALKNHRQAVC